MTADRCLPPDGADDCSVHWLVSGDPWALDYSAVEWSVATSINPNGGWYFPGSGKRETPEHVAALGYRYHSPIPSPDALAALVEAALGAKEELSRLLDPSRIGFHETMRVLKPLTDAIAPFRKDTGA